MTTTVDQSNIVGRYIALRDKKAELKAGFDAQLAAYDKAMTKIEQYFLGTLNASGQMSVRTESGTVYKSNRSSASVADWDAVLGFIKEGELWSMLEHRVSKTAVEQYRAANDDLPPGINYREEVVINIRRS